MALRIQGVVCSHAAPVLVGYLAAALLFLTWAQNAVAQPTSGANVELWTCQGTVEQTWAFDSSTSNIYLKGTNLCLDVWEEFGLLNDTARLLTCDPNRGENQRWTVAKSGEIVSGVNKLCLTATGPQLGANVDLWPCDGRPAQLWVWLADGSIRPQQQQQADDVQCLDAGALYRCTQPPLNALPFCDPDLPVEKRVLDLLGRMTVDEKISQLVHLAAAVARLGVPRYNWWNEALHGVLVPCGERCPTSFPAPIGLGAAFNRTLYRAMATAISTEARAFANAGLSGLDYWAPNINIFRDPRWGRGQETPGEDPYLTAQYVTEYMRGMQEGDDPRYLKVAGTCKHFAAYSLESWEGMDRFHFNAVVSDRDLVDTYLPAFEACVMDGRATSVMCSYNAVNGVPACANKFLLQTVLRDQWEFNGYVVSDCGAIYSIQYDHQYTHDIPDTCGVAMAAGTDLNCGSFYLYMDQALAAGTVTESQVDTALSRLLTARFRLGMFDPPARVPYTNITWDSVDSDAHRALALQAAQQSMVLLKNDNGVLPLARTHTVAVIGPNANATETLLSNYYGTPSFIVTALEGIQRYAKQVLYERGCDIAGNDTSGFAAAVQAARQADVVVLVLGLDLSQEAEGLDRTDIALPAVQLQLAQAVATVGRPLVVVLINGGPLAVPWIKDHATAVLAAGYPGEYGGQAIADVLFGAVNPGGRLPTTWYPAEYTQQISLEDMSMTDGPGRTYRYYTGQPLWPFGFGLSYTTFEVTWLDEAALPDTIHVADTAQFAANVTNTGAVAGDEVVLAFVNSTDPNAPRQQLFGFERVHLQPGETTTVYFDLTPALRSVVDAHGRRYAPVGEHAVTIGSLAHRLRVHGAPLPVRGLLHV